MITFTPIRVRSRCCNQGARSSRPHPGRFSAAASGFGGLSILRHPRAHFRKGGRLGGGGGSCWVNALPPRVVLDASQAVLLESAPLPRAASAVICMLLFPPSLSQAPASWDHLPIRLHPSPCPKLCFQGTANQASVVHNVDFSRQLGPSLSTRAYYLPPALRWNTCYLGSYPRARHSMAQLRLLGNSCLILPFLCLFVCC